MQGASDTSLSGTDLFLAFPLHRGVPLHQRGWRTATSLARRHRERTMVGSVTSIDRYEKLYLSKVFARDIAPALRELFRESTTGVLPDLQNIFLEG